MNSDSFARDLSGIIFLVLLIALPLAYLICLVLLRLYRRAVLQVMLQQKENTQKETSSKQFVIASEETGKRELSITVHDEKSESMATSSPENHHTSLLDAPRRAAIVYSIAGLCYALVMTIVFLSATRSGFHLTSFLMLFWYYSWPVVVTVCLVAAANWQMRLSVTLIYFLALIPLLILTFFVRPVVGWGQIAVLWLLTNFVALIILLAFLNRRIRAVGPFVLTFMIIAVTGSVILPIFLGMN